jgi:imidazolonepropionase-like amidohydrolase
MKSKLAVLAACMSTLTGIAIANAETIYLTAAKMVDPVAGKVIESPAVIITDDRIVSVGTAGSLAVPADASKIDLAAKPFCPA